MLNTFVDINVELSKIKKQLEGMEIAIDELEIEVGKLLGKIYYLERDEDDLK